MWGRHFIFFNVSDMSVNGSPKLVSPIVCNDSVSVESSFDSDDLEDDVRAYTVAPRDIVHIVDGKTVRVLKEGEAVPCETKYKRISGGTIVVKFRWEIRYHFEIISQYNF